MENPVINKIEDDSETIIQIDIPTEEEKSTAALTHFLTFTGIIVPFCNLLIPYMIWKPERLTSPFVDFHGRQSLNFQLNLLICSFIALPLCLLLIGFLILFALGIMGIIYPIIAGMKALKGEYYTYPALFKII